MIAVVLCGVMMGGMTAYAVELDAEPDTAVTDTEYDYTTEPDEIITGDPVEIDITDPDKNPNQLTPPGNLTLVDDLSGAQTSEKQFITVITKSGNYFYIIIDRAGEKENVHFLNLVDEADLLAILEAEKKPAPPASTITPPPEQPGTTTPTPTEPEPKSNNTMGLLIMTLVIAAIGGGAFYYFKVMKPKQGGNKNKPVSELDEFSFDPDEDDFIGADTTEQSGGADYEGDTDEDDIPDFTAEPDNNESEDI